MVKLDMLILTFKILAGNHQGRKKDGLR